MAEQPATPATSANPGAYTSAQVRTRILVYMAIAMITTASSSVLNLAAMTDQQLAALSWLRWTFTILLALFSISLSGLTVFRAAIDRSTSGGAPADPANISTPPLP